MSKNNEIDHYYTGHSRTGIRIVCKQITYDRRTGDNQTHGCCFKALSPTLLQKSTHENLKSSK